MSPWSPRLAVRVFQALWSALYGIPGLLGAGLFWALRWADLRVKDGAVDIVCRGPFARAMTARGWGAFTLGWSIWYWDESQAAIPNTRVHERTHVEQFLLYGPMTPYVYFLGRFRWGYQDSPLEVHARYMAAKDYPDA